jgi:uncharacterized protein (TIGR04141 family)
MVSAKALKQPHYWEELCEKLTKLGVSESRVTDVRNNPPRQTDWTVEFQIADSKLDNGKFNIPFFSRVAFDQVRNELVGFDYDVAIRFIDLDAKSSLVVARTIDIDDLPEEDDFGVLE